MEKSDQYKKGLGSSKKWDGGHGGGSGGGSGGGPYGGGPSGCRGPYTLSDLQSNDHSKLQLSNPIDIMTLCVLHTITMS